MDRLQLCMEVLRRLAKETDDSNRVILAEREINDYLKNEIDALRGLCPMPGRRQRSRSQTEDRRWDR